MHFDGITLSVHFTTCFFFFFFFFFFYLSCLSSNFETFRETNTLSRETTVKIVFATLLKEVFFKVKDFAPVISKFSPF